jgi:obg-like ATPase 1
VDIAGLTRGASTGAGLGNAFLSNVRAVDGLFQVVRAFDDPDIIHIEKTVDPVRDLEIIRDELLLKDMEFALKSMEVLEKKMKGKQGSVRQTLKDRHAIAAKVLGVLEDGRKVANCEWTLNEIDVINEMTLLTAKPSVFIANVSEEEYAFGDVEDNDYIKDIRAWVDTNSPGDAVIPVSVALEQRLVAMSPEESRNELNQLGIESMLPNAVQELRKTLHLISFFTCGDKEVREWSIRDVS